MSTTSLTSPPTSVMPTSTSDSSAPIEDPAGAGNSVSSLFFSSSSSPLIVVFLAVGLFIVVMCGIFGRRRFLRSQRERGRSALLNQRPSPKHVSLSKRPMLWDVWADLNLGLNLQVQQTSWDLITPMTAVLTLLIAPPLGPPVKPPPLAKPMDPGGDHALCRMLGLMSTLGRFYFPRPPQPSPSPSSPPDEVEVKEVKPPASGVSEIEWGDVTSVQVSVIISMPTQPDRTSGPGSSSDAGPERIELGEFCIGTMSVPWSEGE